MRSMDLRDNVQWINALLTSFGFALSVLNSLKCKHLDSFIKQIKHRPSDSALIRVGERSNVSNQLREDIESIANSPIP
jgi:hypothetical protein